MSQKGKVGLLAGNYCTADPNPPFSVMWRSGIVPLEWQTEVVVPFFKNVDWKVCSIIGVSHWSTFLEGVCPSSFMCFVNYKRVYYCDSGRVLWGYGRTGYYSCCY